MPSDGGGGRLPEKHAQTQGVVAIKSNDAHTYSVSGDTVSQSTAVKMGSEVGWGEGVWRRDGGGRGSSRANINNIAGALSVVPQRGPNESDPGDSADGRLSEPRPLACPASRTGAGGSGPCQPAVPLDEPAASVPRRSSTSAGECSPAGGTEAEAPGEEASERVFRAVPIWLAATSLSTFVVGSPMSTTIERGFATLQTTSGDLVWGGPLGGRGLVDAVRH
ncbi:unnamed protein product [Lampetra planeri]